jgi:hypothetical protein
MVAVVEPAPELRAIQVAQIVYERADGRLILLPLHLVYASGVAEHRVVVNLHGMYLDER